MKVLRTVIACLVLIAMVYFISQYAGEMQQKIGVKGASTSRAQEIGNQLSQDIGDGVDAAQKQAMHVTLQDVVDYFSRFKRIPQDIVGAKEYVTQQYKNMVESRESKDKR